MTDLDPERALALAYVPAARRPAVAALWRLDAALGAVLAGGREPLARQLRLAWWRDALERLDSAPPPAGGGAWALVDLARRSADPADRAAAIAAARARGPARAWPRPLRPLGMLALLAARDAARFPRLERRGAPARVARMLRHRLTGR